MADQEYELFAIRHATRDARRGALHRRRSARRPDAEDCFMWLARAGGRTFVIDTGFNAEIPIQRPRSGPGG
jgi:hypothetical protein